MAVCDTVIFLDYPPDVCLAGISERVGKPRADMPWVEDGEDEEFFAFVRNFNREQRPRILELLATHSDKTVVILSDRAEADAFLAGL